MAGLDDNTMTKHDPEKYRLLSEPFKSADIANDALTAFYEELAALREKHHVADLLVVTQVRVMLRPNEPGTALSSGYMGDSANAEILAAFGLGEETVRRRARIMRLIDRETKQV